jgi:hypothetical protein
MGNLYANHVDILQPKGKESFYHLAIGHPGLQIYTLVEKRMNNTCEKHQYIELPDHKHYKFLCELCGHLPISDYTLTGEVQKITMKDKVRECHIGDIEKKVPRKSLANLIGMPLKDHPDLIIEMIESYCIDPVSGPIAIIIEPKENND